VINLFIVAGAASVFLGFVLAVVIQTIRNHQKTDKKPQAKAEPDKKDPATADKDTASKPGGKDKNKEVEWSFKKHLKDFWPYVAVVGIGWYLAMIPFWLFYPYLSWWRWIWEHQILFWSTPWVFLFGLFFFLFKSRVAKAVGAITWMPMFWFWIISLSWTTFTLTLQPGVWTPVEIVRDQELPAKHRVKWDQGKQHIRIMFVPPVGEPVEYDDYGERVNIKGPPGARRMFMRPGDDKKKVDVHITIRPK